MTKTLKLYMAPMAGITDRAFREIVFDKGADYTTTEMVSAKGLYYQDKNTKGLMDRESGKNTGLQIFGSDPEIIHQVIRDHINQTDFEFLDFNMGCPAPKIYKNHEGSYLMSQPNLAYEIFQSMVEASNRDVYLKIRLGVREDAKNFLEIGRLAEKAGIKKVALHARTRSQFYSGQADMEAIKALNEELEIPVIANGDIDSPEKALEVIEYTGSTDLMIGRAALGNPFIFKQIKAAYEGRDYKAPSLDELEQTIDEHYSKVLAYKGDRAVQEMRKHLAWYLKGRPGASKLRDRINRTDSAEEVKSLLENYIEELKSRS